MQKENFKSQIVLKSKSKSKSKSKPKTKSKRTPEKNACPTKKKIQEIDISKNNICTSRYFKEQHLHFEIFQRTTFALQDISKNNICTARYFKEQHLHRKIF